MNSFNKRLAIIFVLIISSNNIFGQAIIKDDRCSIIRSEPSNSFENWLEKPPFKSTNSRLENEVYQIPVVVHIIHHGEPIGEGFNIPDDQILSQLRVINEDFRRKIGTRGFNIHPDGGDAGIEFVLAKSAPDGKATTGIVRVDRTEFDPPPFGGTMVGLSAYYSFWDPYQYLNIWAFPGIQDTGLGEAKFPISDLQGLEEEAEFLIPGIDSLHGIPVKDIDGIAINTVHFGEVSVNTNYNLGRTGTHEMGHFLGLFHIWGDQGFEGNCGIDDYCDDTPKTSSVTHGCPTDKLSCDGEKAMIENYMDYTNDECMNIFTNDQIYRMRTVLENSPRRKSLLTSKALYPPDETVGIPDLTKARFNVYPNPFSDVLYLKWPSTDVFTNLKVQYYDISGLFLGEEIPVSTSPNTLLLNPPKNDSKILFLRVIKSEGNMDYIKLIRK
ncbi:M43 family zinc metalloprotease [Fulvivirga sp.]|uniref:zinc metalloprotease n=1 Tax=Fulvivirga sp. TaxID=1931237 RepID=UPI0032EAE094